MVINVAAAYKTDYHNLCPEEIIVLLRELYGILIGSIQKLTSCN